MRFCATSVGEASKAIVTPPSGRGTSPPNWRPIGKREAPATSSRRSRTASTRPAATSATASRSSGPAPVSTVTNTCSRDPCSADRPSADIVPSLDGTTTTVRPPPRTGSTTTAP
jgi:hypothetical protein